MPSFAEELDQVRAAAPDASPSSSFAEDLAGVRGAKPAAGSFADDLASIRTPATATGLLTPGTIDLAKMSPVQNPDGTWSTVRSISFTEDGDKVILIPTVVGGKVVSNDEAIKAYHQTGKHLGIFATPDAATAYAQQLHTDYAAGKYGPVPTALSVGGQPYVSGVFTPTELDVIGRSPAAQATVAPSQALAAVTPPEAPPSTLLERLGAVGDPEAAFGQIAAPATGVASIIAGTTGLTKAATAAPPRVAVTAVNPKTGQRYQTTARPPLSDETLNAASDVLGGTMQAASPLAIAGLLTAPVHTAISLGLMWAGGAGAEHLVSMAGGSPAEQRFAKTVTEAVAALGGTQKVLEAIGTIPGKAAEAGRVLSLAGRLSGYGTGDVPGYRAEPFTAEASTTPTEQAPSGRTLALEEQIRQAGLEAAANTKESPIGQFQDEARALEQEARDVAARAKEPQPAAPGTTETQPAALAGTFAEDLAAVRTPLAVAPPPEAPSKVAEAPSSVENAPATPFSADLEAVRGEPEASAAYATDRETFRPVAQMPDAEIRGELQQFHDVPMRVRSVETDKAHFTDEQRARYVELRQELESRKTAKTAEPSAPSVPPARGSIALGALREGDIIDFAGNPTLLQYVAQHMPKLGEYDRAEVHMIETSPRTGTVSIGFEGFDPIHFTDPTIPVTVVKTNTAARGGLAAVPKPAAVPSFVTAGAEKTATPTPARDRFLSVYQDALATARRTAPDQYPWPESQIPQVADKMATALAKGSGNTNGQAVKAAAKTLGIKPTATAWKAYFASKEPLPAVVDSMRGQATAGNVSVREGPTQEGPRELPSVSRSFYQRVAASASRLSAETEEQRAETQRQVQELEQVLSGGGASPEAAVRAVWGPELAKASPQLRQAIRRDLAVSTVPSEPAHGTQEGVVEGAASHEPTGPPAVERPLAGRPTAGTGDTEQPARGDRAPGVEGVAGEQPATPAGVSQQPAQEARARKRRARSGRRAASGGTQGTGERPDTRASAGVDEASHVDTADLADTQDVADADARGQAHRWFSVGTAADLTEGGWTRKLDDNLAALRLLKLLDKEQRPASDAEQAVLATAVKKLLGQPKTWQDPALADTGEPEAMHIEESPRRGPVAQATVIPGLSQFAERDVVPGLKTAAKDVVDAHAGIRALWAPARISESADTMATIMRPNLALRRQRDAQARKAMRALEVVWDKMPQRAQLAFAMAVDEGRVGDLPDSQRDLARLLHDINAAKRREANALGGKVGYIEHYYPREWVRPGKVREYIMRALYGKRPLQGRAGFKKARARDKETGEIFSFRELHAAGFEPVSDNPITAHLRKWTEMDKWIAARRILLEGKQAGVATFVKVGEKPPDGHIRYPESFGTVYGPPTVPVKEAYDAGLMEALHRFAEAHGIRMVRRVNLGGTRWGYHVKKGTLSEVHTRFGGPEGVLMHEIGHVLDHTHRLGEAIGLAQASERKEEINFSEVPSKVAQELRNLADLRTDAKSSKHFRQYVRSRSEVIANLVHAFLYVPDLAKQAAPNAYWALYNLAKDTPDLRGLLDIQKARSLRFGVNLSSVRVDGRVIKGYYYGPPDAVRLLENHLSPGLRGHVAFDLYRYAGNFLNRVQLGLSAFHAVFTGLDFGLSQGALALEHASRGDVGKAARAGLPGLATSVGTAATLFGGPVGAVVGVPLAAAGIVGPIVRGLFLGDRFLKAFYERDAQLRDLVHEADLIVAGGGGIGWDTFWHHSAPEAFLKALRNAKAEAGVGNYPGAALRTVGALAKLVPAVLELQAKPIMEWWVPRLKLAAFMDLARLELATLGPHPDPMEARRVLQSAWRSVDNRFGELIYDNIFWHGILKDGGMATFRALGFSLGTVDEILGAFPAQAAQLGILPSVGTGGGGGGKPPTRMRNVGMEPDPAGGPDIPIYARVRAPWLSHKFAYLVSALWFAAIFGALYQYLHTGLRPGEKEEDGTIDPKMVLLDLYFPRTGGVKADGRPERASLPGYMKDFFGFLRHPLTTVEHKLHPMLVLAADIIRNEDYFGNAIRSEDVPALEQLRETLAFIAEQYKPISVQGFQTRRGERGESGIGAAENFLGINVAPQTVTRTPVEEYLHSLAPAIHRTTEQAAQATARRDFRTARQAGDADAARAAMESGQLTRRSILLAARSARLTSLQRAFQFTTLPHAITAYELATPGERADLQPLFARKYHSLLPNVQRDDRGALIQRFGAAMKLPVARPALAGTR